MTSFRMTAMRATLGFLPLSLERAGRKLSET
jgi:hypothetical protein